MTLTKRESVFTSLVSLRKRLSSMEVLEGGSAHGSPSVGKGGNGRKQQQQQQQQHQRRAGLDKSSARQVATRDRIHSDGSAATAEERKSRVARHQAIKKSASLLTQTTKTNRSFEKQEEATPATPVAAKKVKNLNEFYKLAPSSPSPVTSPNHSKNKEEASKESPQETSEASNNRNEVAEELEEEEEEEEEEDGYAIDNLVSVRVDRLPPPTVFGGGNPFLMFMCLACILQHRWQKARLNFPYRKA